MRGHRAVGAAFLGVCIWVLGASPAFAAGPPPDLPGIAFAESDNAAAVLRHHLGQQVVLYLSSGREVQGRLEKVGLATVHLSRLAGRDFFDAAIDLSRVEGFSVQVRR